ncbi:hypothetical protein LCGC14_1355400 [marine sediment metagenome]|uniref:Viral coat protein P2 N-terminal domain-containing protein n=1 Tax=marine sediment metagenome TaxID=412755 RepID=A0A0F9KVV3_9ZZZZ
MSRFIRTNLVRDRTAATEVLPLDLPVLPLSHLIVSLDMFNATDEATLAEILAFINSITVSQNGKTILTQPSEDLYAVNTYLYGNRPVLTGKLATDNLWRCLSLIVPFGRKTFDVNECFPATQKGELTLTIDYAAPATAADNGTLNIEAVQLVGATPRHYLKTVTKTVSAPGQTGDNEISLPMGHEIIAIGIRNTTWPAASSHTFGVDMATVLIDEVEEGYAGARAQCLTGDLIFTEETQHGTIAAQGLITPDSVFWLDYDPKRDSEWLLQTAGKASAKLKLEMGVDEATFVTTMERVSV